MEKMKIIFVIEDNECGIHIQCMRFGGEIDTQTPANAVARHVDSLLAETAAQAKELAATIVKEQMTAAEVLREVEQLGVVAKAARCLH